MESITELAVINTLTNYTAVINCNPQISQKGLQKLSTNQPKGGFNCQPMSTNQPKGVINCA